MNKYSPLKILHLVSDEKFIEFIADVFDSCDDAVNQFLVVLPNSSTSLKYISLRSNMVAHGYREKGVTQLVDWADCIVVHYLDSRKAEILSNMKREIPILWSGWGGDYYDSFLKDIPLLDEATDSAVRMIKQTQTPKLRRLMRKIRNKLRSHIEGNALNAIKKRVDYFSSPVPEDFSLLRERLGESWRANYLQINYGSVEKTFIPGGAIKGNDILIGNSATPSNNHLDIFQICSSLNLQERRLIVPLSYGDERYRNVVVAEGRKRFGENFIPLMEFMSVDQYNEIISSCSIVLMGHRRQQGLGNILTMLYKGASVFLHETSTVYQYLRRLGVEVSTLEKLRKGQINALKPLDDQKIMINRERIRQDWAHDVVRAKVQHAVNQLAIAKRMVVTHKS